MSINSLSKIKNEYPFFNNLTPFQQYDLKKVIESCIQEILKQNNERPCEGRYPFQTEHLQAVQADYFLQQELESAKKHVSMLNQQLGAIFSGRQKSSQKKQEICELQRALAEENRKIDVLQNFSLSRVVSQVTEIQFKMKTENLVNHSTPYEIRMGIKLIEASTPDPKLQKERLIWLEQPGFREVIALFKQRKNFDDFKLFCELFQESYYINDIFNLPAKRIRQIFNPEFLAQMHQLKKDKILDSDYYIYKTLGSSAYQCILDFDSFSKFFKKKDHIKLFIHDPFILIYEKNPALFARMFNEFGVFDFSNLLKKDSFDPETFVKFSKNDQEALHDFFLIAQKKEIAYVNQTLSSKDEERHVIQLVLKYKSNALRWIQTLRELKISKQNEGLRLWMLEPARTKHELDLAAHVYGIKKIARFSNLSNLLIEEIVRNSFPESIPLKLFKAGYLELCLEWIRQSESMQIKIPHGSNAKEIEGLLIGTPNASNYEQRKEELFKSLKSFIERSGKWTQGPIDRMAVQQIARTSAEMLITDLGRIDVFVLPRLIHDLKSTFPEDAKNNHYFKHLLRQLEYLEMYPELRDAFFAYPCQKNNSSHKEVLAAYLTPIRQEGTGNCAAVSGLIAQIDNASPFYLHLLFSTTFAEGIYQRPTPVYHAVNLKQLDGFSLHVDETGCFVSNKQPVWEVPAFEEVYLSLGIENDEKASLTRSAIQALHENDNAAQFILQLASLKTKTSVESLEDSLEQAYLNPSRTESGACELFKNTLKRFYRYLDHPLHEMAIGKVLTEQNYMKSKLHQDLYSQLIRLANNKDNSKTLSTRFFTRKEHSALSGMASKCQKKFDAIVKKDIQNNFIWLWNAELPRKSALEDDDIPELKKIPGGFSLFHQKYGPLDSPEAFKATIPLIVKDWSHSFLDSLKPETRELLLYNGWEAFTQQLAKFYQLDGHLEDLQKEFHHNKSRTGVDQFLPWQTPPGAKLIETMTTVFQLSDHYWMRKEIAKPQDLYQLSADFFDRMPEVIKSMIKSHPSTLKVPIHQPSHGLNLFLYAETPALPSMPKVVLRPDQQKELLNIINKIVNANFVLKEPLKAMPIHEFRNHLQALFSDQYYMEGQTGLINYFDDDISPNLSQVIESVLKTATYDFIPNWQLELQELTICKCKLTEDQQNSEEFRNLIKDISNNTFSNAFALLEFPSYKKFINTLSEQQKSKFFAQVINSLLIVPRTWYNHQFPVLDLNWIHNNSPIYGYFVQNPLTKSLEVMEMSTDGRTIFKVDRLQGTWMLPPYELIYNLLKPAQPYRFTATDPEILNFVSWMKTFIEKANKHYENFLLMGDIKKIGNIAKNFIQLIQSQNRLTHQTEIELIEQLRLAGKKYKELINSNVDQKFEDRRLPQQKLKDDIQWASGWVDIWNSLREMCLFLAKTGIPKDELNAFMKPLRESLANMVKDLEKKKADFQQELEIHAEELEPISKTTLESLNQLIETFKKFESDFNELENTPLN